MTQATHTFDVHPALELGSWLAFPDVPQWQPFFPTLEADTNPTNCAEYRFQRSLQTPSLAKAIIQLARHRADKVLYRALPHERSDYGSRPLNDYYELDWSLTAPSGATPKRRGRLHRSHLWSPAQERLGYFALRNSRRTRSIHLTVRGANPAECVATWAPVAAWIRRMHRAQMPVEAMPLDVPIPARPFAECAAEARALRDEVRKAVAEAARAELGPFALAGREHEPRVTLSRGLAATLRGMDLPRTEPKRWIHRRYYPLRVMKRAAKRVNRRMGRVVLQCDARSAWLKEERA